VIFLYCFTFKICINLAIGVSSESGGFIVSGYLQFRFENFVSPLITALVSCNKWIDETSLNNSYRIVDGH